MSFKVGDRVKTKTTKAWQDIGVIAAVVENTTLASYPIVRYTVNWNCGNIGIGYLAEELELEDSQLEFPFINMGYTGSTAQMFKSGDRIKSKANGIQGTVKSHDEISGVCNVTWDDEWFGTETISENLIELISATKPSWESKCECGSDSVPAYNGHHSTYCPKYKRN